MKSVDDRLIELLIKDGRLSLEELARQLDVSIMTAGRRIRSLTRDGALFISAGVDPAKVGNPVSVILSLELDSHRAQLAMRDLAGHPSTLVVLETVGRFDAIASLWFRSLQEVAEFLQLSLPKMRGISSSETFVVLSNIKRPFTALPPQLIDSPDRDLISLLQENGRRKNAELATLLKTSRSTIGRRLQKLFATKTIIVEALRIHGQDEVVCFMGIRTKTGSLAGVSEVLAAHESVVWLNTCTGRFDIMALARFRSAKDLGDFVGQHVARQKGVAHIDVSLVTATHNCYQARHQEYWSGARRTPGRIRKMP